jgi:hypothetical protein
MDNKQDRQFYWEVKNFMSKNNVPAAPKPQKPDVISSVKNVLEQNNIYKQSSFNPNINSPNIIRQAISSMETIRANGTPNCKAFTKNIESNPFKVIKEGVFDEVNADIEKYSKISGMSPNATNDELEYQISQQNVQPGVPLTPEQKATRDLQGAFQRKQAVQQQMEKEARVQSGQTKINPANNAEFSPMPQGAKNTQQAPAPAPEAPDTQPDDTSDQDEPTREDQQDNKTQTTVDRERAATPAPKAVDDELEARVKARIAKRERDIKTERQSGEENLAYLRSKGADADPRGLVRAERRARGEGTNRLTDEQIRGQEERELARRRRTPEEKAAQAKKDRDVVDDLIRKAGNTRSREELAAREAKEKSGKAPMPYSERAGSTPEERNANAPKGPMPYSERGDGAPAGQGTGKSVSPGAVRQPSSTPAPATPGKTTPPGKAPAPAGQESSLSLKISDGTPSTPAQTGSQVNDKVRQTLGMGASSAPEQASSPGVQGARATLGLGSGSAPAQTTTPGVQGARATLGLGGGAPATPAKAPAPAPQSTAKSAPAPAPAPTSGGIPSVRETLGLGAAPADNNTPQETEAQKKARQALMSR